MIENTATADPLGHLVAMMAAGSDYIENLESAGQRQLLASPKLPVNLGRDGEQADYEALGFVFGDVDPDDDLFRAAQLPAGWTKKPGEHSMWSTIVDENGVERVNVFYKAAFYDRRASMHIVRLPDSGRA